MADVAQAIEADLTWTGSRFERGVRVCIDGRGVIESVVKDAGAGPVKRLESRALMPGFVNVHSHAFQRGLRGRGETFPKDSGSFWTWRDAVYELVETLDEESVYKWSHAAFCEMLASGITTVGEFHYIRHDHTCSGFSFDDVLLRAARDAGIRLVLICSYYKTGSIGAGLQGGQRRFESPSPDAYWEQFEALRGRLDVTTQSLASSVHSVRAASVEDIQAIHSESARRGIPFHIHVEEQHREIADCIAAHGCTPMRLLLDNVAIDEQFTAIHCTHTTDADMAAYLRAGGRVGLCPLTEANLGDGICHAALMHANPVTIGLGTDSNARIDFIEELRWLEYGQRLNTEKRGILLNESGCNAASLANIGTRNGAEQLGVNAGEIAVGKLADFALIDLEHQALQGWTDETLMECILFGSGAASIANTSINGVWRCGL